MVSSILQKLVTDPDPAKASRAFKAMLGMKKLNIAELEKAAKEKFASRKANYDSPLPDKSARVRWIGLRIRHGSVSSLRRSSL